MGGRCIGNRGSKRVEPDGVHAGGGGATDIVVPGIADMKDLLGAHAERGPGGAKFARRQRAIAREPCNLIGIDLNAFVITAARAAVTYVAKRLKPRT